MTEKIFLSYDRQDRRLVGAAQRALRKHGIVTGNDVVIVDPHQKLKAGSNVRQMIKDQISSASKVVIIVSDNSTNSAWVNYEAGMAAALEKPIVIVGKKGSGKTASMLRAFGNVQSIEIEDKGRRYPAKEREPRSPESITRILQRNSRGVPYLLLTVYDLASIFRLSFYYSLDNRSN